MIALHDLAEAAAILLLIELLVVLVIFLAISGGLAFGLWWGRGQLGPLLEKVNGYLPLVTKYTQTGTDYVARPIIMAGGLAATVKATLAAIQRRVREQHPTSPGPPEPGDDPTESIEPLTTT
jgi:hypothetical protein